MLALPTGALEDWRYSRIDALDLQRYRPAVWPAPGSGGDPKVQAPEVEALVQAAGAAVVVETVDGWLANVRGGHGSVTVSRLSDRADPPPWLAEPAEDYFSVLNDRLAPDPLLIEVAPGAAAAPVVVVHRLVAAAGLLCPNLRVRVADGAQATVLEIFTGDADFLSVPVTDLEVGVGSPVSYLTVQLLGRAAWHIARQASRVSRDASLVSAAVALGGDYARLRTESALVGPGASGRLLAVYFGTGAQMHDFRTVQDHRAPKTTSDLLYKGAVAGTARSVYSGLIRVEKGARGTNALQTNRNLVLSEGAHADSVPNLEIEDNDVRCSHASAVGPISDDERFYLESRGVPPEVTERLIALGFLGEVVDRLPLRGLAPLLHRALGDKLGEL